MEHWTSHLRPDGTTFPPVTPDPPPPPGYVDVLAELEDVVAPDGEAARAAGGGDDGDHPTDRGDRRGEGGADTAKH